MRHCCLCLLTALTRQWRFACWGDSSLVASEILRKLFPSEFLVVSLWTLAAACAVQVLLSTASTVDQQQMILSINGLINKNQRTGCCTGCLRFQVALV